MKQNRTEHAARNIAFGMLNKMIMLFVPFIMLSVIRWQLGTEYLGLNNLFTSLLQMLSLAEMGFGSAMVYALYRPAAMNDNREIGALLKLYQKIYRVLSAFIIVAGFLCIPFLPKLIKGTIPDSCNLYILFLVYLLNTVFSYGLFAYKKSLLQAYQRTDIISKISVVTHCGMYFLQLLVLLLFKNYYLYVILLPIFTVVDNLIVNYFVESRYSDIPIFGNVAQEVKSDIFQRVRALAGHKIGAVVISSFDSVVISAFLGLKAVAVYSSYFYIVRALTGIINIGYSSILPGIGNSIVLEDKEYVYRLYRKISLALMWFVGWASVCLLCLFQPFIQLWMGPTYLLSMPTVILFVIYFYVWQIRVAGLAFKDAAGLWREDSWKPYLGLFFNLTVNIILVLIIGMDGVLITTIFVMTAIYFPWEEWVLFKKLFQRSAASDLKHHFRNVALTAVAAAVTYFLCLCIPISSAFGTLIVRGCVCLIVPNLFFWLAYRRTTEFSELLFLVKKYIKKKRNSI